MAILWTDDLQGLQAIGIRHSIWIGKAVGTNLNILLLIHFIWKESQKLGVTVLQDTKISGQTNGCSSCTQQMTMGRFRVLPHVSSTHPLLSAIMEDPDPAADNSLPWQNLPLELPLGRSGSSIQHMV